jgi:hypothetical protein
VTDNLNLTQLNLIFSAKLCPSTPTSFHNSFVILSFDKNLLNNQNYCIDVNVSNAFADTYSKPLYKSIALSFVKIETRTSEYEVVSEKNRPIGQLIGDGVQIEISFRLEDHIPLSTFLPIIIEELCLEIRDDIDVSEKYSVTDLGHIVGDEARALWSPFYLKKASLSRQTVCFSNVKLNESLTVLFPIKRLKNVVILTKVEEGLLLTTAILYLIGDLAALALFSGSIFFFFFFFFKKSFFHSISFFFFTFFYLNFNFAFHLSTPSPHSRFPLSELCHCCSWLSSLYIPISLFLSPLPSHLTRWS